MVNKAIVVGFVGKDPEIRGNGTVAAFSVATSERWTDKNTREKKEVTDWHNVVCFNEALVKIVQSYVKKGSRVYVEGKMKTRKYQDRSGIDRYTTEIVLSGFNSQLVLCDKSEGGGARPPPAESVEQYGSHRSDGAVSAKSDIESARRRELDDEIPF